MLTLPLLVLGIPLADDAHHARAADHLAMLADWFDTRTYLHTALQMTGFRVSFPI
jgi:hypothetical protein